MTGRGIILDFPPMKEEGEIAGVRQTTSIDGILLRAGGGGVYASILLQDLKGNTLSGFVASRALAKEMSKHLYEPMRVHGLGSWDRYPDGRWKLAKMLVQSYDLLEDEDLLEVVRKLQTVKVIWPEDADDKLNALRKTS